MKKIRQRLIYSPINAVLSLFGFKVVDIKSTEAGRLVDGDLLIAGQNLIIGAAAGGRWDGPSSVFSKLLSDWEKYELGGIWHLPFHDSFVKVGMLEKEKEKALVILWNYSLRENLDIEFGIKRAKISSKERLEACFSAQHGLVTLKSRDGKEGHAFLLEFWNEESDFYLAPTNNPYFKKLWKSAAREAGLFQERGFQDCACVLKYPHEQKNEFPIDLVFTWVNANDPDWQEMYGKFRPESVADGNSLSRFYSRDELKYALRSWDLFAPFVRKVFIISNCAPPPWLNLDNPRIRWVSHD